MFDDDDFDPSMHTEDEIRAHEEERLGDLEWQYEHDPLFRLRVDEGEIEDRMDAQQRGLERLAHADPLGCAFFGESYVDDDGHPQYGNPDSWLDVRLHWHTP